MAVVDYERAWHELAAHVASKTQHGREELLTRMAQAAANARVPEGELAGLLRLYGVEIDRARSVSTETGRAEGGGFVGGLVSPADAALAGHHRPDGGHDGRRNDAGDAGSRNGHTGRAGSAH